MQTFLTKSLIRILNVPCLVSIETVHVTVHFHFYDVQGEER